MSKKTFEQVISEQGQLIYTNVGDSMYPLIQPRDLLIIKKLTKPLKLGDIPLYKRDSGQYVLHRIVDINVNGYTMCGDNRFEAETGVAKKQILGILTGIVRNGETVSVEAADAQSALKTAYDTVYLVSCALNGQAPDIERCRQMSLPSVYRFSREHLLTAAVSFALEQVIELPHAFDQAEKKAIRKLALLEIERSRIFRKFDSAGIWYLPLKGIVLKDCYPKAAMREMTDNDILIDSGKTVEVRTIMEKLGYSCDSFGEYHHDVYSKPPSVEFEMHREMLFEDDMPLYHVYYKDIGNRLIRDGGSARRLSAEDFYIHMLAHIYKHYSHAGTGLRSLADVYVYLRIFGRSMDRDYLNTELNKVDLVDFEARISSLANKLFGSEKLNEDEEKELSCFISFGNFGTAENAQYNKLSSELSGDDSVHSKMKHLLRRVFISGESLRKRYPFIYEHKILYPLLIIYRPIKGVFTHPGTIISEMRFLKKFRKR